MPRQAIRKRPLGSKRNALVDSNAERGVAAVEFGLVLVLLVFLFAGVVDLALTLQMKRNLTDSARAAARSGAQACIGSPTCTAGNPNDSDATAVDAIRSVLGSNASDVSKIVIYNSTTSDRAVPSDCLNTATSGISGKCNVIRKPFAGGPVPIPTDWPIGTRVRNAVNAEYLGIYIEYNYNNPVSIYGGKRKLKSQSSFRLEPPAAETSAVVVLPEQTDNVPDSVLFNYDPNWSLPNGYVGPANGNGGG
jgi:Flp pilus assembly pilin Flp